MEPVTRDQLQYMKEQHLKELRLISKMTDRQFTVFKANFTLGRLDPAITRSEAKELLISMIAVNWRLLLRTQEKR
jgi:hypothetical protein|tara:strand:- start:445 stop:669 length:225 start_codon:yes stop_codon:yes gene_type:complete